MYSLKLYHDVLAPKAKMDYINSQHTLLYVPEGAAMVNGTELEADKACYLQDRVDIKTGPTGAKIWRWELERTEKVPNIGKGEGVCSILRMAREPQMFKLVPTGKWLFRLDCIYDFRGTTGLHSHPGSGIRSMLHGHMIAESRVGECSNNIGQGSVWYEEGSYPLVSTVPEGETANFLRGMILPEEYLIYQDTATWIEGNKAEANWKPYVQTVVTLI
jgi:hypothetical protein